jgi:hypothetical protein
MSFAGQVFDGSGLSETQRPNVSVENTASALIAPIDPIRETRQFSERRATERGVRLRVIVAIDLDALNRFDSFSKPERLAPPFASKINDVNVRFAELLPTEDRRPGQAFNFAARWLVSRRQRRTVRCEERIEHARQKHAHLLHAKSAV